MRLSRSGVFLCLVVLTCRGVGAQETTTKNLPKMFHVCNTFGTAVYCGNVYWNGQAWEATTYTGQKTRITIDKIDHGSLEFTQKVGESVTGKYNGAIDAEGNGGGTVVLYSTSTGKIKGTWKSNPVLAADAQSAPPAGMPKAFRICNTVDKKSACWGVVWDGRFFQPKNTYGFVSEVTVDRLTSNHIAFTAICSTGLVAHFDGAFDVSGSGGGTLSAKSKKKQFAGTWTSSPIATGYSSQDPSGTQVLDRNDGAMVAATILMLLGSFSSDSSPSTDDSRELRRFRELTHLCSPEMTQGF